MWPRPHWRAVEADSRQGPPTISTRASERATIMYYTDNSLYPENMRPLIITAAPYAPGMAARRRRRHRRHLGRTGPGRGGLLQRRRHRLARCTCAILRRGTCSADFDQFNYFLGRLKEGRAEDDPPGRRLDLVRAQGRGQEGRVAELRYAPHAGRAEPEAGVRHGRDRHLHDGHHPDVEPG